MFRKKERTYEAIRLSRDRLGPDHERTRALFDALDRLKRQG